MLTMRGTLRRAASLVASHLAADDEILTVWNVRYLTVIMNYMGSPILFYQHFAIYSLDLTMSVCLAGFSGNL